MPRQYAGFSAIARDRLRAALVARRRGVHNDVGWRYVIGMARPVLFLHGLATIGLVWTTGCARETRTRIAATTAPIATVTTTSQRPTLTRAEALEALCDLYATLDVDCDKRITVLDQRGHCANAPCPLSHTVTVGEKRLELTALHQAAQLAVELAAGLDHAERTNATLSLDVDRVFQNPVDYLAEQIDRRYWSGLTRTISTNESELRRALIDEKQGSSQRQESAWCPQVTPRCSAPFASTTASKPASSSPDALRTTHYLYVPERDKTALTAYTRLTSTNLTPSVAPQPSAILQPTTESPSSMTLRVEAMPSVVTPDWVNGLTRENKHGLLTLAHDANGNALPFVVPGGRFNELYGWDSYFIVWGLLESGKLSLARATAEHQAYEIVHYGKVLNANRTYYLTRSQPPFFAGLVRKVADASVFAAEPAASEKPNRDAHFGWIARMLQAAEREYTNVWAAPPRRTGVCEAGVCLARYHGEGKGQPPEVEFGHFGAYYQRHAIDHGHCASPTSDVDSQRSFVQCARDLERAYTSGALTDPAIDAFFVNDRCVRESGHDTTFRWFKDGEEHCIDYATVDLNALLLQYELDVAHLYLEGAPEQRPRAERWCERARHRAALIQRYLWNADVGAYFDYDVVKREQSTYLGATTLYPLWVNPNNECRVSLLSNDQARTLVATALPRLEAAGGLQASAPESLKKAVKPKELRIDGASVVEHTPERQWEAPNGWAPHQMLAWTGLLQHGFIQDAQRLAYRWLLLIAENAANFHGTVPEKFDVVARSHRVFAEYGNVGTEFSYIATEGFGWMNASFLVGLDVLSPEQRALLTALKPTESVFPSRDTK